MPRPRIEPTRQAKRLHGKPRKTLAQRARARQRRGIAKDLALMIGYGAFFYWVGWEFISAL